VESPPRVRSTRDATSRISGDDSLSGSRDMKSAVRSILIVPSSRYYPPTRKTVEKVSVEFRISNFGISGLKHTSQTSEIFEIFVEIPKFEIRDWRFWTRFTGS
jgi:hypothetical protein